MELRPCVDNCQDEDNCQYHLGIDHSQDGNRCQDIRDPSQNGNEHADDQDQWSALYYYIMIINLQCSITILAHEYIHDGE